MQIRRANNVRWRRSLHCGWVGGSRSKRAPLQTEWRSGPVAPWVCASQWQADRHRHTFGINFERTPLSSQIGKRRLGPLHVIQSAVPTYSQPQDAGAGAGASVADLPVSRRAWACVNGFPSSSCLHQPWAICLGQLTGCSRKPKSPLLSCNCSCLHLGIGIGIGCSRNWLVNGKPLANANGKAQRYSYSYQAGCN